MHYLFGIVWLPVVFIVVFVVLVDFCVWVLWIYFVGLFVFDIVFFGLYFCWL